MASAQEIAQWIKNEFDPKQTTTAERIIEKALLTYGSSAYDAPEEAEKKLETVLVALHKMRPEDLPFDFSDRDGRRLIGKQRHLKNDTAETRELQARLGLVTQMMNEVPKLGDKIFEKICAGLMRLSGAQNAIAQCASDDGGIDVYGRLPIRLSDPRIRNGLLCDVILERPILFLGQCKCQAENIGPGAISEFHGSVDDCLRQYEGNRSPPSHRVPATYYRRQELCIRAFFTTADYTEKAKAKSDSLDINLVTGRQISEFLVYHKIGIVDDKVAGAFSVSPDALLTWTSQIDAPASKHI